MKHHLILRVAAKVLIPPIMLFALYVQFHGDYGPGGGFQAGVIFAVALVLYGLVFGLQELRRVAPLNVLAGLAAAGWLLYIAVGFAGLLAGGNFLAYGVLAQTMQAGQHRGVMLIEFGVGVTVAATILAIFQCYAGRERREPADGAW